MYEYFQGETDGFDRDQNRTVLVPATGSVPDTDKASREKVTFSVDCHPQLWFYRRGMFTPIKNKARSNGKYSPGNNELNNSFH